MALFFDGFEQFDKAESIPAQLRKADYTAGGDISTATGRITGKALSTYRSSFGRAAAWNGDIFSIGFAAKFTHRGGMCTFTGVQFILDSFTGLPSFLGVTGGSVPTKGKWYYYEFELHRTNRTVTLFINGKQNGQAAMPDSLLGATSVTLALNAYSLPTSLVQDDPPQDNATRVYDDLYLNDGPRLTPVQVTTRFPSADVLAEWQVLPDDSTHAAAVGTLPTDELDRYILTNKNGASDMFTSETMLPDSKKVLAIGAVGLVRKTDANSGSIDFKVGARVASITNISTVWRYQYAAWLADDGDTADTVNNSQMGVTARIGG